MYKAFLTLALVAIGMTSATNHIQFVDPPNKNFKPQCFDAHCKINSKGSCVESFTKTLAAGMRINFIVPGQGGEVTFRGTHFVPPYGGAVIATGVCEDKPVTVTCTQGMMVWCDLIR